MKGLKHASMQAETQDKPRAASVHSYQVPEHAQLSLRLVTLLEIVSILGSVLLVVWGIAPLLPQIRWPMVPPAILAFLLIAYSIQLRGESLRELGFSRRYFLKACKLLMLPTGVACLILLLVGYFSHSFRRSTHFELNLFVVPIWGVAQQFILQGVIYRRIRQLLMPASAQDANFLNHSNWAIFFTACVFAFVHLPNPALTMLTFIATLLWSWVYERAPNLWALGLSHGVLSLLVMHAIPSRFLQSMSVGYKHYLYQKF